MMSIITLHNSDCTPGVSDENLINYIKKEFQRIVFITSQTRDMTTKAEQTFVVVCCSTNDYLVVRRQRSHWNPSIHSPLHCNNKLIGHQVRGGFWFAEAGAPWNVLAIFVVCDSFLSTHKWQLTHFSIKPNQLSSLLQYKRRRRIVTCTNLWATKSIIIVMARWSSSPSPHLRQFVSHASQFR